MSCAGPLTGTVGKAGQADISYYSQALRQMEPSGIIPLDLPCSPAYSSQVEKGKRKEQVADSRAA